jgi:hypothetical protein
MACFAVIFSCTRSNTIFIPPSLRAGLSISGPVPFILLYCSEKCNKKQSFSRFSIKDNRSMPPLPPPRLTEGKNPPRGKLARDENFFRMVLVQAAWSVL